MNYITTTELRTKSSELVNFLLSGGEVDLIHRSKIIATIQPKMSKTKVFNARRFKEIVGKLNLPYLTDKEIEKRYREAMIKKHGKYLL